MLIWREVSPGAAAFGRTGMASRHSKPWSGGHHRSDYTVVGHEIQNRQTDILGD